MIVVVSTPSKWSNFKCHRFCWNSHR